MYKILFTISTILCLASEITSREIKDTDPIVIDDKTITGIPPINDLTTDADKPVTIPEPPTTKPTIPPKPTSTTSPSNETTISPPIPTTKPPTTTSVKPTTPSTTTTTTTTVAPVTTPSTKSTSTTTPLPVTTAVPHTDRKFDGPSFIGGIVLASGLMAIGFVAWKFYKARTERNYHTL